MDFHHFRGNLILPQAGTHHLHGLQLRVDGKIDGLAKERNFRRRFDQAKIGDVGADVFGVLLRDGLFQPIHNFFLVRIAAQFVLVRKNGVNRGKFKGEDFEDGAKFRIGKNRAEPVFGLMSGSSGDMRTPFQTSLRRSFRAKRGSRERGRRRSWRTSSFLEFLAWGPRFFPRARAAKPLPLRCGQ